ncbi:MAG: polysaccharide deacetylase family protein [Thaumarchaeota archaeon]|nr:polysaccharide deacetylase family protein [Nitrososphaerota archaeon]
MSYSASYSYTNSASAQAENVTKISLQKIINNPCNCVIFRLDDVRNDWLTTVQLNVMDQFISKNQSLSLGLIMHKIDNKSAITEKIKEGNEKGLFNLDIHGWDHVDYTQLSKQEQLETLQQANEKMSTIFGHRSQVFIPPYNKFNGDTIEVLKSVGIRVISSYIYYDKTDYFISDGRNEGVFNTSLYHLPAMTTFKSEIRNGIWEKVPIQTILNSVDDGISKYGYAVIMLHPQNFAKMENGIFVNVLDEKEMKDLSFLIDSIRSKNIQITTFTNVVGLNNETPSQDTSVVPEFYGMQTIVLMISTLSIILFTKISRKMVLQ